MRKLLVISPDDLSDDVATALQEKHWSIRHVRETDALERLVQEEHILVGLIVFPVARDTRHETHLCRQISRSTGLKWVAIVNEGQIQQPDQNQI